VDLSLILASCLISLVGLPHGALDPVVAHRHDLIQDIRSSLLFFAAYAGLVSIVVGFWLLLPQIALLIFLFISCIHFGRDWKSHLSLGGFGYGAWVLGLPALTAPTEVEAIFSFLIFQTEAEASLIFLQMIGATSAVLLWIDRTRLSVIRIAELFILAVSAYFLEPLWFFVVYFCGFHSPRHIVAEFRAMKKETRFKAYVVMLLTTILTLSIAAVSGSHLERYYMNIDMVMYQIIFIGLAALTVPHMCLLEWAERQAK